MIPYFEPPVLKLGPVQIHAFGVLVATGILVGSNRVIARGKQLGLTEELTSSLSTWVVLAGFVMAHIFDVFAYQGGLARDPWVLLKFWSGISSFGGFLGALLALLVFTRVRRVGMLACADSLLFGLSFGWFFGRLGCFTAYDHPGLPTHFFLGERYVDGVVRHNLGLEEALFAGLLTLLFVVLYRKPRKVGLYAALACTFYGPVRMVLDFMRVPEGSIPGADTRYWGLTPAQYGSVGVFLVGLVLLIKVLRSPAGAGLPEVAAREDDGEGAGEGELVPATGSRAKPGKRAS